MKVSRLLVVAATAGPLGLAGAPAYALPPVPPHEVDVRGVTTLLVDLAGSGDVKCDETVSVPAFSGSLGGRVETSGGVSCDGAVDFIWVGVDLLLDNVSVASSQGESAGQSSASATASQACVPGSYHAHLRYLIDPVDGDEVEGEIQTDPAFVSCVL